MELKNFHRKDNKPHDTYQKQYEYVKSLNNKWAMENFLATCPYVKEEWKEEQKWI